MEKRARISIYAWFVVAYNIAVILWGAYVRATGFGAGCGNHWPLCNGEVLPRSAAAATMVEFTHRVSSGLALLLVFGLVVWVRRRTQPGHSARMAAGFSGLFILTEAAIGAGLVLLELVAENDSVARALFISLHLVNTFLLLGALTLTAWWLSGGKPVHFRRLDARTIALGIALLGVLIVGVSGAITALGDTLFPPESVAQALSQPRSQTAHFLMRLRVWHPLLAIVVGIYLVVSTRLLSSTVNASTNRYGRALTGLVWAQLAAGTLNVALHAPIWLQLVHLLLADLLWMALILFGAGLLTAAEASGQTVRPRAAATSPTQRGM